MEEVKPEEPLITAEEVAVIMRVKKWRIYQLVRENHIPPGVVVRLGPRSVRFHHARLWQWINDGGAREAA